MTTQTADRIYHEVKELRQETEFLKNIVLAVIRDPEGDYKPEFVKRVLQKAQSKPEFSFKSSVLFLKHIRG